jgi:hypothetical protein
MNGGTKTGFSTISLERLQCARRDSASPQKEEEEEDDDDCQRAWLTESRRRITICHIAYTPYLLMMGC